MKSLEIKPIVKNNDHTKLALAQNKKILLGQGDFQVVAQGEFMGEWYFAEFSSLFVHGRIGSEAIIHMSIYVAISSPNGTQGEKDALHSHT